MNHKHEMLDLIDRLSKAHKSRTGFVAASRSETGRLMDAFQKRQDEMRRKLDSNAHNLHSTMTREENRRLQESGTFRSMLSDEQKERCANARKRMSDVSDMISDFTGDRMTLKDEINKIAADLLEHLSEMEKSRLAESKHFHDLLNAEMKERCGEARERMNDVSQMICDFNGDRMNLKDEINKKAEDLFKHLSLWENNRLSEWKKFQDLLDAEMKERMNLAFNRHQEVWGLMGLFAATQDQLREQLMESFARAQSARDGWAGDRQEIKDAWLNMTLGRTLSTLDGTTLQSFTWTSHPTDGETQSPADQSEQDATGEEAQTPPAKSEQDATGEEAQTQESQGENHPSTLEDQPENLPEQPATATETTTTAGESAPRDRKSLSGEEAAPAEDHLRLVKTTLAAFSEGCRFNELHRNMEGMSKTNLRACLSYLIKIQELHRDSEDHYRLA